MSETRDSGLHALETAEIIVKKIGGDNAVKIRENYEHVKNRLAQGQKQVLAVSAIRSSEKKFDEYAHPSVQDRDSDNNLKHGFNTTSHLIALAEHVQKGDLATAWQLLKHIQEFTFDIVFRELAHDKDLETEELKTGLGRIITSVLDPLAKRLENISHQKIHALEKDWVLQDEQGYFSITGLGEGLAQTIYQYYFQKKGLSSGGIQIDGIADRVYGENPENTMANEQEFSQAIDDMRQEVRDRLSVLLEDHEVIVGSGYLPVLGGQRGYSDKTGALFAQAVKGVWQKVVYVIEKMHPILSTDPRKLDEPEKAQVVPEMTYELGMELFGTNHGADGGAIHPDALQMLKDERIPTLVLNPSDLAQGITHIHYYHPRPDGVEIIASRDTHLALQILSTKMIGAGFLGPVTTWMAKHEISIDQMATSEVTVSFTFNNGGMDTEQLEEFRTFLREQFGEGEFTLEKKEEKSLIFCLGNKMHSLDLLARSAAAMEAAGVHVHLVTKGLNEQVMVFMVDKGKTREVTRLLHEFWIERREEDYLDIALEKRAAWK